MSRFHRTKARRTEKDTPSDHVDPAVVKVQQSLEENLTFFMENIADLVKRFDAHLTEVLPGNPKAKEAAALLAQYNLAALTGQEAASAAEDNSNNKAAAANTVVSPKKGGAAAPNPSPAGLTPTAARIPSSPLLQRPPSVILTPSSAQAAAGFPAMPPSAIAAPASPKATATKAASAGNTPKADNANDKKKKANDDDDDAGPTGSAEKAKQKNENGNDLVEYVDLQFPDNTLLIQHLRALKREAYEVSTTFDGIHDWIALNVPAMMGEENEGVEVMGAVIEQVSSFTEACRGIAGTEAKYYSDRQDIEKALLRQPKRETLKKMLDAIDSNTWDDVERGWRTMIRICLLLHSTLSKNMKKLKDPREVKKHSLFM